MRKKRKKKLFEIIRLFKKEIAQAENRLIFYKKNNIYAKILKKHVRDSILFLGLLRIDRNNVFEFLAQ